MSTPIEELDVVRVTMLSSSERAYSGTEGVCRAPQLGDLATVVHVLEPGQAFIVEAVNAEGYTLWVADFMVEELRLEVKHHASA